MVFLWGCGQPEMRIEEGDAVVSSGKTHKRVSSSFENVEEVTLKHSQWLKDREKPLDITIIGPIYETNTQKKSPVYKKMKAMLEQIYQSSRVLDLISGTNLKKHFKNVDYIPYSLNSEEHDRVNAVLNYKTDSRANLNTILRDYNAQNEDKNNMSIAIKINFEDLERNYFTIEGYKSVKEAHKVRNSSYFKLSKYLGNNEVSDVDLTNAIALIMQMSISEHVSIDRSKSLKKGKKLRIVQKLDETDFIASIWSYEAKGEIENIKIKIADYQDHPSPRFVKLNNFTKSNISALKSSTDGNMMLLGEEGKMKVYSGFKLKKTVLAHDGKITALDISPRYIASGGEDAKVRIYSRSSQSLIKNYNLHELAITQVSLVPNTNYVVSGSKGDKNSKNTLKLWDINTGRTLADLRYHSGSITALDVSKDGLYAVSAGEDNALVGWDISSRRRMWSVTNAHNNLITDLSMSDDGKYVITSSWDKKVILRDVQSGRKVKTFDGFIKAVSSVEFIDDSKFFLTADRSGEIKLFDMRNFTQVKSLHTKKSSSYVGLSGYKNFALSLSEEGLVSTLDTTPIIDTKTINTLRADIKMIEESSQFNESKTYQKLYTKAFSEDDLKLLAKYGYIDFFNSEELSREDIKKITSSLGLDFLDPVATVLFFNLYKERIGIEVTKQGGVFILQSKPSYSLEDLYFTSSYPLKQLGYKEEFHQEGYTVGVEAIGAVQE